MTSLAQRGRSETADTSAVRAVSRGVELVSYALVRARAAGVGVERLAELLHWEPELVREALDRGPDHVLALVVPGEIDREAVPRAAATVEAMTRLDELLRGILADVTQATWSPAAADLDDLHDGLATEWRSWRARVGQPS